MKDLLKHAREQLKLAQEQEALTGEAMDSMNRTYWEGFIAALPDEETAALLWDILRIAISNYEWDGEHDKAARIASLFNYEENI